MNESTWWANAVYYGWVIGLLLVQASLVSFQFALIRLRYSSMDDEFESQLKELPQLQKLLEEAHLLARIIRFSITGITIGVSILMYLPFRDWRLSYLGQTDPAWATEVALTSIIFIGIWYLQYFIGEIIPRGWGLKHPERAIRRTVIIVRLVQFVTSPLRKILRKVTPILYGWMGLDKSAEINLMDIEVQTRALGEKSHTLSPVIRQILKNTLRMDDLTVFDIMIPRNEVQFLDTNQSYEANLALAKKCGHTRYPLCEEDLDHCIGLVHIKDVFRKVSNEQPVDFSQVKRPIHSFKENESLETALQYMLKNKLHMTLIKDDFGGTAGVMTMEQILEELVGEIQDEFDLEERLLRSGEDGLYKANGLLTLHELSEELGIEIDSEEVSTIGGLVISELGHIPNKNETVSIGRLRITVDDVTHRRVLWTTIQVLPEKEE